MFGVEKMHDITDNVLENRLSIWKQLKFEIAKRAYTGHYNYFLRFPEYEALITTLRDFRFEVEWNKDEDAWEVKW